MYAGNERRNKVVALVLAIVLVAGVVLALLATMLQAAPAGAVPVGTAPVGAAPAGAVPAHAQLVASVPANESTVDRAPEEIRLTFDEPVTANLAQVRLIRDATTVETSPPAVDGTVVTVKVLGAPGIGGYRVVWHVAGPDGHPNAGESTFGVGQAAPKPRILPTYKTPQSQPTTFGDPDHLPGLITAGVLLLGGLVLLVYEQRRRRRHLAADPNEEQRIS